MRYNEERLHLNGKTYIGGRDQEEIEREESAKQLERLNHRAQAIRAAELRNATSQPLTLTDRERALVLNYRKNDERGQKLADRIVALHAAEYPKQEG